MSDDAREDRSHNAEPRPEAPPGGGLGDWLRALIDAPNDSPRKTLFVAVALCLVCSVVVSSAAVLLKPIQETNRTFDRKKNILEVAGLLEPESDIDVLYERIEARVVDLESGTFSDAVDPADYDQRAAARDPRLGRAIPAERDIAGIGRRARYALVYLVRDGERIAQVILPVHGYGLWSTLYGFLSLEGDLRTVAGLKFYEHRETPGLGGEVDNSGWRAKWEGKLAFDEDGRLRLEVIKGAVDDSRREARFQVDGLAGATLTSRGITNLLHFWLGEEGFGPFLDRLRGGEA